MLSRPRRLRKNPIVREMVAETRLSKDMFIYPYFIVPGTGVKHAIDAMPGVHHFSIDTLIQDVENGLKYGINKIMLFGVGDEKSEDARSAYHDHSLVPTAVRALKQQFGDDLYVVTDVCVCSYTTHGHCGIMHDDYVQNDATVELIAKMALTHAQAGADLLAPSDMMDGRILAIRNLLDSNGYVNTGIMSHATKFASAYYGPFREAADCAPSKGDRKAYQMDFRNGKEALREALIDESEGADILMVKPALAYLDVIADLKQQCDVLLQCFRRICDDQSCCGKRLD
jgi:porphobilinogen synthase